MPDSTDETRQRPPTGDDDTLAGPITLDGQPVDAPLDPTEPRYVLGALLGKGGMGEIRLAHDSRVDRDVAVKLLRSDTQRAGDATVRFLREARVQGRLDHPAVVPVHDLGVDARGTPFFAMKRLTGTTLADVLDGLDDPDARARWPRRLLLDRLVDVCLAIEFAHTRGVVHRDLKPQNIMLGDFGEAYVLDWGVAKVSDDASGAAIRRQDLGSVDEPPPSVAAGHTAVGSLLGTPGYMPPEQMRGEPVDARADVYALGCVLFEILTGHPALPHGSAAFEATLAATAHHPRERHPDADVPPELDDACARATAPRAADRTRTARDLATAIRSYLDGDRDLERRRELARRHAADAVRALATGDDGRADAMRAAGRAIALDPTSHEAQEILGRLLVVPPTIAPPQVARDVEAERVKTMSGQTRVGAWIYLGFLASLPILVLLGERRPGPLLALAIPILANAGFLFWWSGRNKPVGALGHVALIIHGLLLVVAGVLFGPLTILPMLAIGSIAVFVSTPTYSGPIAVFAVHFGVLAIPLALEWSGVLPRTYTVTDAGVVLDPWGLDIAPSAIPLAIVLIFVLQVLSTGVLLARLRRSHETAQEEAHLLKWHYRQLAPERVSRPPSAAPTSA
jgi:serine/threonine-protein kinase